MCSKVTMMTRKCNITSFVKKKTYHAYFKGKLGNQDKAVASHRTDAALDQPFECLPFGIPIIWRMGRGHTTDCYLCMTNLKGEL